MTSRKKDLTFTPARAPSHRLLRVAEEVRQILSALFLRGDLPAPGLPASVTITQVKLSADLQHATVYVMPLGGLQREETLAYLKEIAGFLRHQLGKELQAKFTPALRFRIDDSFDQAERIEKLLKEKL
jgi:ribosome-binding factor A